MIDAAASLPNLSRWMNVVAARPAVAKAMRAAA
jgi:glutathione S-transferase